MQIVEVLDMGTHGIVKRWFQDNRPLLLDTLKCAVELESPSTEPALVNRFVNWTAELLAGDGWSLDWYRQRESGDMVLASFGDRSTAPGILMLAHADTVWPAGELERFPWSMDQYRAAGPGIYDMKAGLIMGMLAGRAMSQLGLSPPVPIRFLITSDEETGSWHSVDFIRNSAAGQLAVFCLEPAIAGTGALKTARKGVSEYQIDITGRAAHSGSSPGSGISAIRELAVQIEHLYRLENETAGTTLNVGTVWGGTRSNVIAETAGMRVDVRTVTSEEARRIDLAVKGLSPVLEGAAISVSGGIERPPFERTDIVVSLFNWARSHARQLGFELEQGMTGGASDGNFTAAAGIPTLDGLGAVGAGSHSRDEHIIIEPTLERAALLTCLLLDGDRLLCCRG